MTFSKLHIAHEPIRKLDRWDRMEEEATDYAVADWMKSLDEQTFRELSESLAGTVEKRGRN